MPQAVWFSVGVSKFRYSARSAVTGSLLAALREGINPPSRVSTTLRAIRIMAETTGREALISVVPAREWIKALPGISRSRVKPMPMSPAQRPMIKVSALNTWEILCLEAPMARRMPISFFRSNTLI